MAEIAIKDRTGQEAGVAELSDAVFGIEPNTVVMHQVVRSQRAAWRGGNASTRTRGMVRGGGRKPFRQKGTGRARQGTIRAPHYDGGGIVFGPHPRDYAFKVNAKEIKLALRSALSSKCADGELVVVSDFGFEEPKTREAAAVLKALGLADRRVTVVVDGEDVNAFLSFRNLPKVNVIAANAINTLELLDNKALVVTESALKTIEEVLA